MATCEYEVMRQQKIAENRRRMEQLGVQQLSRALTETNKANRPAPKPRVPRVRNAADLVRLPARRSSRAEGKPAPNYNENALDVADRVVSRKARQPFLGEVRASGVEEVYTEEHLALLGDYKEPWELFVDGTDASGKRVYDKVNGMTCHQCRQKTLGKHTSCSCCDSLQGVLCGDCLFMRYGENILEVAELDDWKCPVCRGLCNCSNHRLRKGWLPTGSLYRRAIAEGYRSVSHYLVLTKQASALHKPVSQQKAQPKPCGNETMTECPADAQPQASAEPGAEDQAADAVQEAAYATESQKSAAVPKVKRGAVQQILSTLLPQSKTSLPCDIKLKSKKRSHDDIMDKPVGLKTSARLTRSRSVKVM